MNNSETLVLDATAVTADAIAISWLDAAAFAAPALMCVELRVVGRVFGSDILLITLLPLLLLSRRRLLTARLPMTVILLEMLWLAGQVATDLWRGISFQDLSRGWSMIVFGLCEFATLYMLLYGSRQRIVEYALGLAVGGILSYFFDPNVVAADYPWKFGYGAPITILIVVASVAASSTGSAFGSSLILLFAACLNLYMGFRSLAGVCFVAFVFLAIQNALPRLKRASLAITVAIWIAGLAAAAGAIEGYGIAASTGLLGYTAQQKFQLESGGEFGVLLGGRGEIFSSVLAIRDSPIIGHGSWAKDPEYAFEGRMIMRLFKYYPGPPIDFRAYTGLIPSHSYLFGAWVDGGILGALFWTWVFVSGVRAIPLLLRLKEAITPLIAFFVMLLVWDILFSPYGAAQRFFAAYEIVLATYVLQTGYEGARHRAR